MSLMLLHLDNSMSNHLCSLVSQKPYKSKLRLYLQLQEEPDPSSEQQCYSLLLNQPAEHFQIYHYHLFRYAVQNIYQELHRNSNRCTHKYWLFHLLYLLHFF